MFQQSTTQEVLSDGIKVQSKQCYQFQTYGRPFVKREGKISLSMLQLGINCNRKGWQNQN